MFTKEINDDAVTKHAKKIVRMRSDRLLIGKRNNPIANSQKPIQNFCLSLCILYLLESTHKTQLAAMRMLAKLFVGCSGKPADKQKPHEQRTFQLRRAIGRNDPAIGNQPTTIR